MARSPLLRAVKAHVSQEVEASYAKDLAPSTSKLVLSGQAENCRIGVSDSKGTLEGVSVPRNVTTIILNFLHLLCLVMNSELVSQYLMLLLLNSRRVEK